MNLNTVPVTVDEAERDSGVPSLVVRSPRTGEQIGSVPAHTAGLVTETVADARNAAAAWAELQPGKRKRHLDAWRKLVAARRGELLELLASEAGKARPDAELEVGLALHHLQWAAAHGGDVLAPERVGTGLLMLGHSGVLVRRPVGVVGVIGPWNYPVYTPMGSIAYALATGNAVVFKPSEYTSLIGRWLVDVFSEAVPEHPVFRCVYGRGDVGSALVTSGVDKVAFTGSAATGKKVMAACAEHLTPVLMELGGKDAAIVDLSADLDDAADSVVWGSFMNAGQTCAGVERVYVVDDVYPEFLKRLTARAELLKAGTDYGAITMPTQVDTIRRHIDAALADGGRAVVGGPESVRAPYVDPVVLVDVPESSAAVREETFGPVVIVNSVPDVDEAIARANAVGCALGGAVFSANRGREIASRLKAGMVSINGVVDFGAVPELPFGGNGESGFGRIHGKPGLCEFTTCQSITQRRVRLPIRIQRFSRTAVDKQVLKQLAAVHRWLGL